MVNVDTSLTLIAEIIDLDTDVQRLLRINWPEAWSQINLPLGSTRALLAIEMREARTPGRVAEALGVSRTTVTGLLDRLESAELITRAIDPADRRCFILQVTDRGRALVAQIEEPRREQLALALATLAPSDLHALRTGLAALANAMQTGTPTP